jgi:hypothetical protein
MPSALLDDAGFATPASLRVRSCITADRLEKPGNVRRDGCKSFAFSAAGTRHFPARGLSSGITGAAGLP